MRFRDSTEGGQEGVGACVSLTPSLFASISSSPCQIYALFSFKTVKDPKVHYRSIHQHCGVQFASGK